MECNYLKIILEFISSLSWPIVCLIVFYFLRKPITTFLKKVKKVSYGDASIERPDKRQREDGSKINILESGNDFSFIEETFSKFSSHTRDSALDVVNTETKISEIESLQQKFERLLKYSQLLVIIKALEKIYQAIYGSQIRMLQKLNFESSKAEHVKYFYDNAAKHFPEAYSDYSYSDYLNYLVEDGLILYDKGSDIISISDMGRDFLRYLVESNANQDKLY